MSGYKHKNRAHDFLYMLMSMIGCIHFDVGVVLRKVGLAGILFLGMGSVSAQDSLVGGTLTEDQMWTNEYVYIVYKDLRIPEGVTLKIKAGVTVKIDQGRGILVLGGNLLVDGQQNDEIDSVHFVPNHLDRFDGWKWKGISYTGVAGINNKISYANIVDAEIAIDIYNSSSVIIENSCILNNQNIGVRLYNSKVCEIYECLFQGNYDGIEMVATNGDETSGNAVKGCVLKNFNHNIYLLKAFGGMFISNLVEKNLIEGGNNGIWMDNGGGEAFGKNLISKNIFINNGADAGYGLLLAQDSIDVRNNIFWKNRIAIFYDQFTSNCLVLNNSFYQNEECILLSVEASGNIFENNTFSTNIESVIEMYESQNVLFKNTNIFPVPDQENIFINKTPDDIVLDFNYWHNSDDDKIQNLIWDKNDDPDLGTVIYNPVLAAADTTNPISPPLHVIKQWVNDQVKLSWIPNPEKDQRTYRAYYGNFENYKFSDFLPVGNETSISLSGANYSDSIAVTALDNTLSIVEAQVRGHESPFAFAVAYPYAGNDAIICKNQSMYQIKEGTIPFDYESISWSTSGDGSFINPYILSPVYYPGPEDKTFGEVILTMGVSTSTDKLYDSLTIYIYDTPVVSAGNDTVIFEDAQLDLITATANFYETVYWISTGDGVFNYDTLLNPIYTPGEEDIISGEVNLVLMGFSECGMASDTMLLNIEPFYSLEGRLWFHNEILSDGAVLAVKDGPGEARAVEMKQATLQGAFKFERLMEGNYYVYAVPDTLLTNGAVPGYYANNLRWQQAHYFTVDADVYDVDISLPSVDYQLPIGEASISGYFEMPSVSMFTESIYCNSWFEFDSGFSRDYCDGGLSNITVFLYNSTGTKLLDFTLTDEHGNFYFQHLPYGSYIIDAEKAGYQTSVSSLISLSPNHKNEIGVVLTLNAEIIAVNRTNFTNKNITVEIYPNPTRNRLHIFITNEILNAEYIEVYNTYGRLVLSTDQILSNDQNTLELDVSGLPAGMYLGRWIGEHTNHRFTFIKN